MKDLFLGGNLQITLLKEQFRFPRSKKVRIRKKWAKNPANWRPVRPKRVTHYVRSQVVEGAGMTLDCTRPKCMMCEHRVPMSVHVPVLDLKTGTIMDMRMPEALVHQIRKKVTPEAVVAGVNLEISRDEHGYRIQKI